MYKLVLVPVMLGCQRQLPRRDHDEWPFPAVQDEVSSLDWLASFAFAPAPTSVDVDLQRDREVRWRFLHGLAYKRRNLVDTPGGDFQQHGIVNGQEHAAVDR